MEKEGVRVTYFVLLCPLWNQISLATPGPLEEWGFCVLSPCGLLGAFYLALNTAWRNVQPTPSREIMSQLPCTTTPNLLNAPGLLIRQSHSQPWLRARELLHGTHSPLSPAGSGSPTATAEKATSRSFQDYTEERKSTRFKQALWLWLLLLLQESGPCVRVSAYSASLRRVFPPSKGRSLILRRKGPRRRSWFKWGRKLIKWFSRGVGTYSLIIFHLPSSPWAPLRMNSRTLVWAI